MKDPFQNSADTVIQWGTQQKVVFDTPDYFNKINLKHWSKIVSLLTPTLV